MLSLPSTLEVKSEVGIGNYVEVHWKIDQNLKITNVFNCSFEILIH